MSKGKFIEATILGPDGSPMAGGVQEQDITKAIENSYFFGNFMAYYFVLMLVKNKGAEQALKFADKKFMEIGKGNPSFLKQAEKLEANVLQYYRDSMENKDTHVKEK